MDHSKQPMGQVASLPYILLLLPDHALVVLLDGYASWSCQCPRWPEDLAADLASCGLWPWCHPWRMEGLVPAAPPLSPPTILHPVDLIWRAAMASQPISNSSEAVGLLLVEFREEGASIHTLSERWSCRTLIQVQPFCELTPHPSSTPGYHIWFHAWPPPAPFPLCGDDVGPLPKSLVESRPPPHAHQGSSHLVISVPDTNMSGINCNCVGSITTGLFLGRLPGFLSDRETPNLDCALALICLSNSSGLTHRNWLPGWLPACFKACHGLFEPKACSMRWCPNFLSPAKALSSVLSSGTPCPERMSRSFQTMSWSLEGWALPAPMLTP